MEILEDAAQEQREIEIFANRMRELVQIVEVLEEQFYGLADYPEHIASTMSRLVATANTVANDASEWARIGNFDFVAATPFEIQQK